MSEDPATERFWRRMLAAILVLAAGLRLVLAWRGGQLYWPDENRYLVAVAGARRLLAGDVLGTLQVLLATADHLLFKFIGLLPGAVEELTGFSRAPMLFWPWFSLANIALVARVARQAGAGAREATLAAALMACANTGFYYSRHFLPYDAALTFGLLAMSAGWDRVGSGRSLLCGLLAGAGFLTYNGSWLFGGMALCGHVLLALPSLRLAASRAVQAGAGLVLFILVFIGLARVSGSNLVADFLRFSQTINQGDFGRGWAVTWQYFWSAEGGNLLFGLAGVVLALVGALAARKWTYGLNWVAGMLFILAGLILLSDVWPKFVIYGRTARQLTPLVCLAVAYAGERLWRTGPAGRRLAVTAGILILLQAVANFSGPLGQMFPDRFRVLAGQRIAELQAGGEKRQLVIVHADRLLGDEAAFAALPDHQVLFAAANPMRFGAFQLEGHTAQQRAELAAQDTRMQLIALNRSWTKAPEALQQPYPGVVQLTVRLPPNRVGAREPLVVTGSTGRGDILYLIYDSPTSIRLGFDHWGTHGTVSDPIEVDYASPQIFALSLGPMHGPPAEGAGRPDGPDLRAWLYVRLNGRIVWSQPAEFHPAAPSSVTFALNPIGGSTCEPKFTGEVVELKTLTQTVVAPYVGSLRPEYPGAVKLELRLPPYQPGIVLAEPLVISGRTGAADLIYLRYDSPTTVQLGFDHWGTVGLLSDSIPVAADRTLKVTLSMGPLYAPEGPVAAGIDPRAWLYAEVNGRPVWSQPAAFHPTESRLIAFGQNRLGMSTCAERFTGEIQQVDSVAFPPAGSGR